MGNYVDGCLLAVPAQNKAAYLAMATICAEIFFDHGAIAVSENWQADVSAGKKTDFFRAVAAEEGENIVFSWIIWPSKEARDAGWAASMADPRMAEIPRTLFDGSRAIFGGFENMLNRQEGN